MDLQIFYSDKKRLSYNPDGVVLERAFPKSLLAFDDRFLCVSRKLQDVIEQLYKVGGSKLKILDIGIGDGVYEGIIFNKVKNKCDFYVVDISKEQIKRSSKYLVEGLVVDLDSQKLPYKSKMFDIVIVSELLEHVFFPEKVIREAKRVLRKDGILIITYPNLGAIQIRITIALKGYNPMINYSNNKEHIRFFRDSDIDNIVGLRKIYSKGLGSIFFHTWNCGFRIPTPRIMQKFVNEYLPSFALGNISIYKK